MQNMEKSEIDLKIEFMLTSIRETRLMKNYKQEYVAARINFSQNAYSKIECGKTRLTVRALYEIAAVLEINAADILR
jgi:transcriptional regulator with XRE-family HTH domain